MSTDARWIVGTILTATIALAGELATFGTLLASQHTEIRAAIRRLDDRVRAVEVAIASYHGSRGDTTGTTVPPGNE